MDALEIGIEEWKGEGLVRLSGTLDGRTARKVAETLGRLPRRPLVVDFSRVRTFVDLAVDALTLALRGKTFRLTGLGRHQQRMFRYFGVLPLEPGEAAEA